jgi:hypothetical protein
MRRTGGRRGGVSRVALASMLTVALTTAGASAVTASTRSRQSGVPATRDPLTGRPGSAVSHDTETMAIVAHAARLYAATDQWEYRGPSPAGQVLVKLAANRPWKVFEQTQSLRVQALDSFAIPQDQGLGRGNSLLITQAIVNGRSRIQWLLDRASSFTRANSYALPSLSADVRAFGAHESGGSWAIYAGVAPAGILRGTWSRSRHTLVFSGRPELTVAPPGSPGLKTQKVTGFADCGGSLFVSINTKLFRRNDGALSPGEPRWSLVYQTPPVGPLNSGLRGLTCITYRRSRSLLVSFEGNGNVYRLDHLARARLTPVLELTTARAIASMLAAQGTRIPSAGTGSIDYVIAAYNNFLTATAGGVSHQLFGFEWNYHGSCPAARACTPTHWDAAACFAVRTEQHNSPTYLLRCLSGRQFAPAVQIGTPVRGGQAFVSIRTIARSPFADGSIYFGGFDCNFYPADGTAWIAHGALGDVLRGS